MAKNRYIGEYPVIGIRPTIDGRRGPLKVREGLDALDQLTARTGQPAPAPLAGLRDKQVRFTQVVEKDRMVDAVRSLLG